MSNEKMREEFEVAYTKRLRDAGFESVIEFRRHEDGYANLFTDGAWWGWQASRAAIEVPAPDDGIEDCQEQWGEQSKDTFDCGYNFASMRYDQAIESLGLKVKP